MDVQIFQALGGSIDESIKSYVDPSAASLISVLHVTAISGIGLYFTCMGYLIITGSVQESFYAFIKQCLKIIIIAAIAFNIDTYTTWVVGTFHGFESGLSVAMSATDQSGESTYQILDHSINRSFELVGSFMEKADGAGWHIGTALGWLFAAIIVGVCGVLVTVLGGATIIAAKFSLAVMFALGPLFIMCLMWPVTARFFESWFSQVMNYIMTIVIMVIVMTFAIAAFEKFAVPGGNINEINPLLVALKIFAMTLILMFVIRQVSGMAAGLSGGFSMAALTITNLARGTVSPITAYRGVRDFKNDGIKKEKRSGFESNKTPVISETPTYQRMLIENLQNGFKK